MLTDIHNLLRDVVIDRGGIPADEVDIRFESPTRAWIDGLARPTLDFALIDIEENLKMRDASPQTTLSNGHAEIRMPACRFDLRYMVTALTSDADDSHQLLWRALVTLMSTPELPTEFLPEAVRNRIPAPLMLRVAQVGAGINVLDAWSAAGADMRPSFCCIVTVPVDLDTTLLVPLVLQRTTNFVQKGRRAVPETFVDIGGVLRDSNRQPVGNAQVAIPGTAITTVADDAGRYVLHHVPMGHVIIQVARPNRPSQSIPIEIPSASPSYDLRVE